MSATRKDAPTRPVIGRFHLTRKIGTGGQGTVYEAHDPALDRRVAIKVVHADSVSGALAPGELPREARMAARLQHPSIVAIHDVGYLGNRPYLVFELVDGRTFREILEVQGAMPARRALALIRPVLAGMAHAHERGVLHLDLNPRNLMLGARDLPRILDFGLAQIVGTRQADIVPVGTLLYMAPEQLEEKPFGPPVDVRALGLVLYEMLTGRCAIIAGNICRVAQRICDEDIDLAPIDTCPQMSPVADFLAGALARAPAERYPNAVAMLQAFEAALERRARIEQEADGHTAQSTVAFLLRRLQRRKDFPALSSSLTEINRLTAPDSRATIEKLGNVVLRDFALSKTLLKLANSPFYGLSAGEVRSISHAISLLGFEQVRVTANSLLLSSHLRDRDKGGRLRELLLRAFVAALLARHLARRGGLRACEEAFLCGMFQSLGELLTVSCFPEEHAEIEALLARGQVGKAQAARLVLGIDLATLGAAVARDWHFPGDIVGAIAGLADEAPVPTPANDAERLRDIAVLADSVCEILGRGRHETGSAVFGPIHERFRASVALSPAELVPICASALDKLDQFSSILGIQTRGSLWYAAARACVAAASTPAQDVEAPGPAAVRPRLAAARV